jgi:hypothetical protein
MEYASVIQEMKQQLVLERKKYHDSDASYPVMQEILKEQDLIK